MTHQAEHTNNQVAESVHGTIARAWVSLAPRDQVVLQLAKSASEAEACRRHCTAHGVTDLDPGGRRRLPSGMLEVPCGLYGALARIKSTCRASRLVLVLKDLDGAYHHGHSLLGNTLVILPESCRMFARLADCLPNTDSGWQR